MEFLLIHNITIIIIIIIIIYLFIYLFIYSLLSKIFRPQWKLFGHQ